MDLSRACKLRRELVELTFQFADGGATSRPKEERRAATSLPAPLLPAPGPANLRADRQIGNRQAAGVRARNLSGWDIQRQRSVGDAGAEPVAWRRRNQHAASVAEAAGRGSRCHGRTECHSSALGADGSGYPPELVARDGEASRGAATGEVGLLARD